MAMHATECVFSCQFQRLGALLLNNKKGAAFLQPLDNLNKNGAP